MQPKSFFKKVTYFKFEIPEENKDKMKQSILESLAEQFKFKRCKESMFISMGFVHPISEHFSESGLSYVVNNWFLFAIQIEEKQISNSEVNYELQMQINEIQKNEHRNVTKPEKSEMKEKILSEKVKTAPSKFSTFNIAFDNRGNMFINTTSKKPLERVTDLIRRVFEDYMGATATDFSSELTMASTKLLKQNKAEIPEGVDLSLGTKGEGKNGGRKISFDQITSDDQNILSMISGYDLEVTKMEIYHVYKNCPISYYMSNKGIESISYGEEFMEFLAEDLEDASSEKEEIDLILSTTFDMLVRFHVEYFVFLKKIVPYSKGRPEIIEKVFHDKKELSEFLSTDNDIE